MTNKKTLEEVKRLIIEQKRFSWGRVAEALFGTAFWLLAFIVFVWFQKKMGVL